MTFRRAARKLRACLGRSQQLMATSMGLSMAALRNYESGAVTAPDARAACAYLIAADNCGRTDLAVVFGGVLRKALALPDTYSLPLRR